ncbi:MAG: peptidase S53, partial [Sulfolobus sp.]|nr:peptidase S53 [Sulfolobus sp.]
MRSSSLVLSVIFLISLISPVLVAQNQNPYIQPIQIHGFKNVGTLPKGQTVVFTVYVPLKNLNLLYYYAQAVSNPSSPLYHHFLSKEQIAKLFYPTKEFNQVLSYLKENGFKVLFTSADSVIVAQGTVGQIEDALGVNYAL